jgi:predicted PurR-regulated permease PerM
MALPAGDQLKYWGIAAVVFAVVLWFLGDVLLPFVLGGAIAYFLDPVADRLERMGCTRIMATASITVVGLVGCILLLLWVIP